MRRRKIISIVGALCVLLLCVAVATAQGPETQQATTLTGPAFTYQGRLTDSSGNPVSGSCDFSATLYADAGATTQVATADPPSTTVDDGRFTIDLDFGAGAFDGTARWLKLVADCGDGAKTFPLQRLTPAPHALFATGAPWSGLTGVPAGFADGTDDGLTSVTWTDIQNRPAGLDDGDDNTTYSAGTGLSLSSDTFSLDTGYSDNRYWKQGGNASSTPGTDFLGTSDNTALELKVNDARALRIEPGTSPNIVGGFNGNSSSGVVGATIGGGGASGGANSVAGDYSTVGGGKDNSAGGLGAGATVGGGESNAASNSYGTVAGGISNVAGGNRATIGGGESNLAQGYRAFIGGGYNHDIGSGAQNATIAGGRSNQITNEGDDGTIAGGWNNTIYDNSGTIGGGNNNVAGTNDATDNNASNATVAGGTNNTAGWKHATVGGGTSNQATGFTSSILGGAQNTATQKGASVGGGENNEAGGAFAVVPGGENNVAGGQYSLAAGRRAKANHNGSFVWADSTDADFTSSTSDQFLIRADGGVGMGTNSPGDAQLYVQDTNCCTDLVVDNHIAVIENTSANSAADVLALKSNRSTPNTGVNFITFFDAGGIVGEIEGDGAGGIVFDSASSDFAERLPKQNPGETLAPGEVVGVADGEVSKRTTGAERAMVVSTAPIVLGNRPSADEDVAYTPIAFVGQVPVKVRGSVSAGNYIIPSGANDGVGIAVTPEEITAAQAGKIVGRALEHSAGTGVTKVNTLVGLPQEQILTTVLEKRDARVARLEARIDTLSDQNEQLVSRMNSLERTVQKRKPAPLAGLSIPPWLLGGLLFGGIVIWQRKFGRNLS